ncbi:MAG: Tat pathway signal protein [Phenylobacterium sp.]
MDRRHLLLVLAGLAAPGAAMAAGGEKTKSGGGSYVPIQTLIASTTRSPSRRGVLTVDCGLDVPDEALRLRATQSAPRLRAAFVQTLQAYAAGLAPGAVPNVDYLASTLQRQTDAILGKPGAKLLLGVILVN